MSQDSMSSPERDKLPLFPVTGIEAGCMKKNGPQVKSEQRQHPSTCMSRIGELKTFFAGKEVPERQKAQELLGELERIANNSQDTGDLPKAAGECSQLCEETVPKVDTAISGTSTWSHRLRNQQETGAVDAQRSNFLDTEQKLSYAVRKCDADGEKTQHHRDIESDITRLRQDLHDLEHAHLSVDIERLLEPLSQPRPSVVAKSSDFATQMARVSMEAMHKDRQLSTCKALIAALSDENASLTRSRVTEDVSQPLHAMRTEREQLLKKISRLEKERDQMSLPYIVPDTQSSTTLSNEAVQKMTEDSEVPTPALQQKVEKLKATVDKLLAANRRWDEHCKQLKREHDERVAEMEKTTSDLKGQLDERLSNDTKRQKDIDRLLLSTKKRLEFSEADKGSLEERVEELRKELARLETAAAAARQEADRSRVECEAVCRQLEEERASRLLVERQLQALRATSTESRQFYGDGGSAARRDALVMRELREQIALLQQQITLYKDDFDNERNDRERAQRDRIDVQSQLDRLRAEYSAQQRQLQHADAELMTKRDEVQRLCTQLAMHAAELKTLRLAVVKPWQCAMCTYKNPPGFKFCEVCGYQGGVGVAGTNGALSNVRRSDPSLFAADAPPLAPSAPHESVTARSSNSENLSSERVVVDTPAALETGNARTTDGAS